VANRTSWVADALGQGLTYGSLFAAGDINSLTAGSSVRSSVTAIANGTNLAMFMDISYLLTIASSTIAAGANFAFWIYNLNQDASHYGDNQLPTAGTSAAITPAFPPCATVGIPAVATTTTMYGTATGIVIPPGTFTMAIQNNCGFNLSGSGNTIQYRTYNINLNA
jgi:hypothetical protein